MRCSISPAQCSQLSSTDSWQDGGLADLIQSQEVAAMATQTGSRLAPSFHVESCVELGFPAKKLSFALPCLLE